MTSRDSALSWRNGSFQESQLKGAFLIKETWELSAILKYLKHIHIISFHIHMNRYPIKHMNNGHWLHPTCLFIHTPSQNSLTHMKCHNSSRSNPALFWSTWRDYQLTFQHISSLLKFQPNPVELNPLTIVGNFLSNDEYCQHCDVLSFFSDPRIVIEVTIVSTV